MIIEGIQATQAFNKIRSGKPAMLSVSQIALVSINLPQAKKNLTKQEYDGVYQLFEKFSQLKTKELYDYHSLDEKCMSVLEEFDKIAPISFYDGNEAADNPYFVENLKKSIYEYKMSLEENEKYTSGA